MEDEDEPAQSGLLSPRRIEANYIAFNKVFDNARQEGMIRDPSSYRSFEEVYELAMARRNGVDITDYTDDQVRREHSERKSPEILEDGRWERENEKGPVVINSQESRNEDILFSDEEVPSRPISSMTPSKRKKSHPPKRKVEVMDDEDEPRRKKKHRTRQSEPVSNIDNSDTSRRHTFSALHLLSSDEDSSPRLKSSTIKSDDPPLLLPPSGRKNKDDYEYRSLPPDTTVTIVLQRDQPPKPPTARIPFFGRVRGASKKISYERLWEVHYRIERIKKAALPVIKKSLSVPYAMHKSAQKVNLPGYDPVTNGYSKSMEVRGAKRGNGMMRGSSMRGKAIGGTTIRGSRGGYSGRGRGTSARARRP